MAGPFDLHTTTYDVCAKSYKTDALVLISNDGANIAPLSARTVLHMVETKSGCLPLRGPNQRKFAVQGRMGENYRGQKGPTPHNPQDPVEMMLVPWHLVMCLRARAAHTADKNCWGGTPPAHACAGQEYGVLRLEMPGDVFFKFCC